jgi:hypothetical protein
VGGFIPSALLWLDGVLTADWLDIQTNQKIHKKLLRILRQTFFLKMHVSFSRQRREGDQPGATPRVSNAQIVGRPEGAE